MAGDGREGKGPQENGSARRAPSPSPSVEVVSRPRRAPFRCETGRLCERCLNYHEMKEAEAATAAAPAVAEASNGSPIRGRSSSSSGSDNSEKSSASESTNERSPLTPPASVSEILEGMENSNWGGVDRDTQLRCRHGKHPRRLLCWDGKNTGRRYLGCPMQDKSMKRRFVQWLDDQWPPRFQEVVTSLWDVFAKHMSQADKAKADFMGAVLLRNEMFGEKEALIAEKEEWVREKAALIKEKEILLMDKENLQREVTMRTRFAHTSCTTLQNRVKAEVEEKQKLWYGLLCMFGLMVAIVFGVVLKHN